MQILKGEFYQSLSDKNRLRVIYLEAARGQITDRHQKILATSRISFNCTAIPREAKKFIDQSLEIIAPILQEDAVVLLERYKKGQPGAFQSVVIAENLSQEQAIQIEELSDRLPGILIETRPQRIYPYGESSGHLLGTIGPLADEERQTRLMDDYSLPDWVGKDGLEKSYENFVRGYSGGLQIEVNNRGKVVRTLGVKEPKVGKDLEVSIDADLNAFIHKMMISKKSAVAVMDLSNGELVALVSTPSFDPNLFATKAGRRKIGPYFQDDNSPLLNRCLQSQCPPGSIFKIVTAAAGLSSRKITDETRFFCPGFYKIGGVRFGCWKEDGHGSQNLTEAFTHSCNTYFFHVGVMVGIDYLSEMSKRFGFSKKTNMDLPSEKKGFLPTREWKRKNRSSGWFEGETANLSIGQGDLLVTPMQALVMVGAAATGGKVFTPHVVRKINGVAIGYGHIKMIALAPYAWAKIQEGLSYVVAGDDGTGRLARVEGLVVSGKTGTAQSGQKENHAWFVGYAPKNQPKYAAVVFVENGGRGGIAAAKMASRVFGWMRDHRYFA